MCTQCVQGSSDHVRALSRSSSDTVSRLESSYQSSGSMPKEAESTSTICFVLFSPTSGITVEDTSRYVAIFVKAYTKGYVVNSPPLNPKGEAVRHLT